MDFKKLIKTYGDACDRSARAPRMSPSQQSAIELEQQAHLALVEGVMALTAERDKLAHDHHLVRIDAQARVDAAVIRALAAERERDELRARLAERLDGQETKIAACAPYLRESLDGRVEAPAQALKRLIDERDGLGRMLADRAAEIERMRTALESIKAWADAYPLESFPEPRRFEWQRAAALLSEKGISLGNMSASNIRHVINGVRQFVASGLGASND